MTLQNTFVFFFKSFDCGRDGADIFRGQFLTIGDGFR